MELLLKTPILENTAPASHDLPAEVVREQLNRILQTRLFRHSPRLCRFFSFTVDQALTGCEQRLKEYSIALEVFGKPETFDPRMDSAVRVAARQLRAKIDLYYLTEGAQDPVLIRYRPGDYIPRFYNRNGSVEADNAAYAYGADGVTARVATVVEKDRNNVRSVTECLDSIGVPIAAVVDSAEQTLDLLPGLGPCFVISGLDLSGAMNGAALTRHVHQCSGAAMIALVPTAIESALLHELVLAEPDALLYQPVRPLDLRTALRIAYTRKQSRPTA